MTAADATTRAEALLRRFSGGAPLPRVRPVAAADVPEPARSLLAHDRHMTEAQERFHGGLVNLRVLAVQSDEREYAREILLARDDGTIVEYGIVRIDLGALDPVTAARVIAADVPLGRILAEAGILRTVGDVQLVEFVPGTRLAPLVGSSRFFGRVAGIRVQDRSAIDLLEIVTL
jgi:chorismate-pyruvate lyase